MALPKKEPYIRQIALYISNKEFDRAYILAQDFSSKFKGELIAHFLMAKAAFRLKKFYEASIAARKAFALANNKQDMIICAIILAASYYVLGDRIQAYQVLNKFKSDENPDIEKLMLIFVLSAQNEGEAMQHIEKLYSVNRRLAEDFIQRFF